MITDTEQIQKEMLHIISDSSYIPIRTEDFTDICPNITWAIHICSQSIDVLVEQLNLELAQVGKKGLNGIIVYIRCASLTMADLSRINDIIPNALRFKRGLGFDPGGEHNEIWLFAEEKQEWGIFFVRNKNLSSEEWDCSYLTYASRPDQLPLVPQTYLNLL